MGNPVKRGRSLYALALVGIGLFLLSTAAFCGEWTGYGFGTLTGADWPNELFHGDFATHQPNHCDDLPQSGWAMGTLIALEGDPVLMHHADDSHHNHSVFSKGDTGDHDCEEKDEWIDVYFGRWRLSGDPCVCPGVDDSVCYVASTNSCDNASTFGRALRIYNLLQLPPCC